MGVAKREHWGWVWSGETPAHQANEYGNLTVTYCPIPLCRVAFQSIWPVSHERNAIFHFRKTLSQQDILLLSVLPRNMVVGGRASEIKAICIPY